MKIICEACAKDPTSHSFRKVAEDRGVLRYYTNPTKATMYTDTEGILKHYDNELASIGSKPWSWIFDSDGFDWRHAIEIQTGIGIAKLITQKYGSTLQSIRIINPTWHIQTMLFVVWPFLSQDIQEKITISSDRYYSLLEFI
jgi:hypothetical protein